MVFIFLYLGSNCNLFLSGKMKYFTIPQCRYFYEMIYGSHCTCLCMPHILLSNKSGMYVPKELFPGVGIILVLDQILLA